jgi:hypothetical protein
MFFLTGRESALALRRRQLAWIGPNQFVHPNRDGLGGSVVSSKVKTGDLRLSLSRPWLFVRNRQRLFQLCHILLFRAAGILQA